MKKMTSIFPLLIIATSTLAYFYPATVTPLKSYIVPFLTLIMFCMGVTLTPADFKRVLKTPKIIAITLAVQFFVMPLAAFAISKALDLSSELTVGMVLVGAVSGGTASNVIAYIAKADVALSITLTVASTFLAVFATPLLTFAYLSQSVPVDMASMLLSILKIVVVPVAAGLAVNYFFADVVKKFSDVLAVISILSITIIIAVIFGLNQEKIAAVGASVTLAVILHNLAGLISGYYAAKWFGYDQKTCKTVAIEVGMQNSGLAVALALKYFAPVSALPGAIFSIWHNISGSAAAWFWSRSAK